MAETEDCLNDHDQTCESSAPVIHDAIIGDEMSQSCVRRLIGNISE